MGSRSARRLDEYQVKLLAHNDGTELRGNERQLLLLTTALQRRGHEVLVSCRAGAPLQMALRERGIATDAVRPRGDLDILSSLRFAALAQRFNPDAALLTSWKRIANAAFAISKGTRRSARTVVRLGIVREFPRGWNGAVLRFAFANYVDALVVNSNDVAQTFLRTAPWFDQRRLRVILNAVESSASAIPTTADPRTITFVGGIERRKGIDLIIRALPSLPADVVLQIAGRGREQAALQSLAAEHQVEQRVRWLGQRSDIPAILAASSVFVLPSRQDSLANAMLEAMAAGVPVVAAAGSGVGDALGERDGRPPAGWIVPTEDPAALAAAIDEALQPNLAQPRAAEARWRAEHWFTVHRMADAYEQLLFR